MDKLLPNVSVCICSYNQVLYLEKAIRSAVMQTIPPTEIIVSDDCSTDGSSILLDQLSLEIPALKVFHQQVNTGIAKNTDFCLRQATSEFVVRLDSDDLLLPHYVEELMSALLKHPNAGYAHAGVQEINERGAELRIRKIFRNQLYESGDKALRKSIDGYRVTANILMFRRSALSKVDYMAGRPNFGEDYHLTAALSSAGFGNVYLNQVLAQYRVWTDVGKVRQKRKLNEIIGIRKVFDDVIEPGYLMRGWNTNSLRNKRAAFACNHADCLGWNVYNEEEKNEILVELRKLSSSFKVDLYCLMYSRGYGWLAGIPSDLVSYIKSLIKPSMLKLNRVKE
jgi:glycosyltransferase involved in cell wall biosynthesis